LGRLCEEVAASDNAAGETRLADVERELRDQFRAAYN
jgi:hypothetical protein